MNPTVKKIMAALSAAMCLVSAVGCAGDEEAERSASEAINNAAANIDMGNTSKMPYGSCLRQILKKDDPTISVGIEYDDQYIEENEARALADYVASISECNGKLLEKCFYKPRLDLILEGQNETDASVYLKKIHDNLAENYLYEDFEFNYVLIKAVFDETDDDSDTGFSIMDNFIREKAGQETVDKITARKLVQYDVQYSPLSSPDDKYILSRHTNTASRMYIYTIDGVCYIM